MFIIPAAMPVIPEIQGTVPIRSDPASFMRAFRERLANGLLTGQPHPRSNYVVSRGDSDRLQVRAADWWTAMNVGLNEIELELPHRGTVRYRVQYRRWTALRSARADCWACSVRF